MFVTPTLPSSVISGVFELMPETDEPVKQYLDLENRTFWRKKAHRINRNDEILVNVFLFSGLFVFLPCFDSKIYKYVSYLNHYYRELEQKL